MAFRFVGRRKSSTLRPIEIGRKLLSAIDDGIDTKDRRLAPDKYTISLSEPDRESLADDEQALIHELTTAATAYIRDEKLNVLTTIDVTFSTDASLDIGQLTITASISHPQRGESSPTLEPRLETDLPVGPATETPPPPAAELPPPLVIPTTEPLVIDDQLTALPAAIGAIVHNDGKRHPIGDARLKIGRSTENSVQVIDGQASRYHAEVRYENGQHHIVDLDSTNGTLVNGNQIEKAHALSHGDIIRIGTTEFRYESS